LLCIEVCVGESKNDVLNQQKTSEIPNKILNGKNTYADAIRKVKRNLQVETL